MSISLVYYSNTFADWISTTNTVVNRVNIIETGDFVKSSGTMTVSVPTIYTSTLDISGRTSFSGNTSFTRELLANNAVKLNGTITFGNTAIINVSNTNLVANLNSELLDGKTGPYYLNISQAAFSKANSANTNAANASFLSVGTVSTARLGSGTANANTYLRGDNTWSPVISGATLYVDSNSDVNYYIGLSEFTTGAWLEAYASNLRFNPSSNTLTVANVSSSFLSSNSSNITFSQCSSLGVGTTPSANVGEIRATATITAYYSDKRLKENIRRIENPIDKLKNISGVYYNNNATAESFGYKSKENQVGVIAQEIQEVLPEAIRLAPFDSSFDSNGIEYSISGNNYLTVQYEKIIPLLIEVVKTQQEEIEILKDKINKIKE